MMNFTEGEIKFARYSECGSSPQLVVPICCDVREGRRSIKFVSFYAAEGKSGGRLIVNAGEHVSFRFEITEKV